MYRGATTDVPVRHPQGRQTEQESTFSPNKIPIKIPIKIIIQIMIFLEKRKTTTRFSFYLNRYIDIVDRVVLVSLSTTSCRQLPLPSLSTRSLPVPVVPFPGVVDVVPVFPVSSPGFILDSSSSKRPVIVFVFAPVMKKIVWLPYFPNVTKSVMPQSRFAGIISFN